MVSQLIAYNAPNYPNFIHSWRKPPDGLQRGYGKRSDLLHAFHIALGPGCSSCLRPRNPPKPTIKRTLWFSLGGVSGGGERYAIIQAACHSSGSNTRPAEPSTESRLNRPRSHSPPLCAYFPSPAGYPSALAPTSRRRSLPRRLSSGVTAKVGCRVNPCCASSLNRPSPAIPGGEVKSSSVVS